MSDLIESIKQGAEQVISSIDQKGQIQSAIQGIRNQLGEIDRKRKIGQLESQIKSLQSEMKQLTEALGLQTLSLYDIGKIKHVELTRLCDRINELRSDLEQQKADLAELKVTPAPKVTMVKCPRCQTRVPDNAEFCPKCGERLQELESKKPAEAKPRVIVRMRCPKCKTILPQEGDFCPKCGVKIKRPQTQPSTSKQFCASCGAELNAKARFCPVCGKSTN